MSVSCESRLEALHPDVQTPFRDVTQPLLHFGSPKIFSRKKTRKRGPRKFLPPAPLFHLTDFFQETLLFVTEP